MKEINVKNLRKFKIPYKILTPEKETCPMTKLSWHLQAVLETKETLSVISMWVNEATYNKLSEVFAEYVKTHVKSKKAIAKEVSMYNFTVGPACDWNNRFGLEDDYLYYDMKTLEKSKGIIE